MIFIKLMPKVVNFPVLGKAGYDDVEIRIKIMYGKRN